MSVALFGKNTFENAVTTGTILAEDGSKMSKSKKNYPDPTKLFETHGVDALRLYLMSSAVMKAENLNFSEEAVGDIRRRVLTIWWNVFSFYRLFAKKDLPKQYPNKVDHVMDKWLVSITERLTKEVTEAMDKYDVVTSSRKLMEFVGELSTWYLRRSRDRLRNGDKQASQVFGTVLYKLSLLFAPFAPFLSELIYQNLVTNPKDSVHLEAWPNFSAGLIHSELEENMRLARDVVEKAHSLRKEVGVRLRQPLAEVKVSGPEFGKENLHELILEEINVKKISFMKGTKDRRVELNTTLIPALREEGEAREIVRAIQQARKEAGTRLDEKVEVELPAWPEKHETEIMEKVLASKLTVGKELKIIRK
jgi:isoleucyl-tRNA synthetase